jgi:hypothetical protein
MVAGNQNYGGHDASSFNVEACGQGGVSQKMISLFTTMKISNNKLRTSMGRQKCSGYISSTIHFDPEGGGCMASKMIVSNHYTTK